MKATQALSPEEVRGFLVGSAPSRVQGAEPDRALRVDRDDLTAAGVLSPGQEAAWRCPRTAEQGRGTEFAADYPLRGPDQRTASAPRAGSVLHQFPFLIVGFHSDNGSEFVNRTVADLLNKLLVKLTRSRPNRRSDNALVVGKNGAIIRKHIGCGHIATNTPTPSSASIRRTSTRT